MRTDQYEVTHHCPLRSVSESRLCASCAARLYEAAPRVYVTLRRMPGTRDEVLACEFAHNHKGRIK